ncbi:MAG: hypothetical protein OZ928_00775 [Polyangiaceae bacterium]|nr:hypothetical protein [Polyangiaceae bacterium]
MAFSELTMIEVMEALPEAGDVEVGKGREHALDERDEPRPKGVEVFDRVVDGRGTVATAGCLRGGKAMAARLVGTGRWAIPFRSSEGSK